MADILDDMLERAVDSKSPLAELMRRCLVLSYKLDMKDFRAWAENELNGYDDVETLPEYRIQKAPSYGCFFGAYGRGVDNYPIPMVSIPKEYRHVVDSIYLRDSVGTIEAMLPQADNNGATIRVDWSPDLIALVGRNIIDGYSLASAWTSGTTAFLYEALEIIRNRILQFVLEVKNMVGALDELKADKLADLKEPLNEKFSVIVMGDNHGNIAGNHAQATMNVTTINIGDMEALRGELDKHGLDSDQINELEEALASDHEQGQKGIGARVSNWIANFSKDVATGVIANVSVDSLPSVIDAIKQFVG